MLYAKLQRLIRFGSLTVTWPNGRAVRFGPKDPMAIGPDVAVRLIGALTPLKLAIHPDLFLGEAYMDGRLRLERGTLWDLFDLIGRNVLGTSYGQDGALLRFGRPILNWITQSNSRRQARQNASYHYDLSDDLYRLFLDKDMQYSCAYFARPDMTIDEAQAAKKSHLAAKLRLSPGQRILDIGCGWGGLALSLAQAENVDVLGITLSTEQLNVARERAKQLGLSHRVSFELIDFRDVRGPFDRIVSVGMFEHVGVPNYTKFFEQISRLLAPGGIAVLHAIGRMHGPSTTSHWIQKYIFPGGYVPALSQVIPRIEDAGLWITDLEVLRLHYANTLKLWREKFLSQRSAAAKVYDERFCRMWEFYLVVSEMSFRYGGFMIFQTQLAAGIDNVPLTRDYLFEAERDVKAFHSFSIDHSRDKVEGCERSTISVGRLVDEPREL